MQRHVDITQIDPQQHCFICRTPIEQGSNSVEHVIPRWAQKRHDLFNQRLFLINKTEIQYRQLIVPCCSKCNNDHWAPIERDLSEAVKFGRSAVLGLGKERIYLWLAKVY